MTKVILFLVMAIFGQAHLALADSHFSLEPCVSVRRLPMMAGLGGGMGIMTHEEMQKARVAADERVRAQASADKLRAESFKSNPGTGELMVQLYENCLVRERAMGKNWVTASSHCKSAALPKPQIGTSRPK